MEDELLKIIHDNEVSLDEAMIGIITSASSLSSSGHPYIAEDSFDYIKKNIPLLFRNGSHFLNQITTLEAALNDKDQDLFYNIISNLKVLRNIICTSAITAPSDLWIARYVLANLKSCGLTKYLTAEGKELDFFYSLNNFDIPILRSQINFLLSRGILRQQDNNICFNSNNDNYEQAIRPIEYNIPSNMVPLLTTIFSGSAGQYENKVLSIFCKIWSKPSNKSDWFPNWFEIELGYRMVPIVLALTNSIDTATVNVGTKLDIPDAISTFFQTTGIFDESNALTHYGDRVLKRGPGPFGIIHAYYPYMQNLAELTRGERVSVWVARGENVLASQDANKKSFLIANKMLDQYCQEKSFEFDVFIEHAVGSGEATRQRFEANPDKECAYFGADLEDAAIDQAIKQKAAGVLPPNMEFIRQADIGKPEIVIEALKNQGVDSRNAVMMVGNGFHEIRNQTNDLMVEILKKYADAGIILIFTEESALENDDLLNTAWNTYHAGFRFVHEISGQELRPARDKVNNPERYSWRLCAREAGYSVLEEYTAKSRTIYPHPREDGYNPSISVSYFCVPDVDSQFESVKA